MLLLVTLVVGGCGAAVISSGAGGVVTPTIPGANEAAFPMPAAPPAEGAAPPEEETAAEAEPCLGLGSPSDATHAEFYRLLNEFRQEHELVPLEYSVLLQAAADDYARQMCEEDFFGHVDPDGKICANRALAAGFCHDFVGENLAWSLNCRETPAEAMIQLEESEEHRENMLVPDYRYVGVGYWTTTDEMGTQYWWVQMFALDISN